VTRDNFVEHLRRKRAEASSVETTTTDAKTTAQMTDDELQEAITESRRELLEAQRAALRERERARVAPEGGAPSGRPNLGSIFNKSNRRFK
jgi:TfoX/Sxy family transcriptional regulator of competence genes